MAAALSPRRGGYSPAQRFSGACRRLSSGIVTRRSTGTSGWRHDVVCRRRLRGRPAKLGRGSAAVNLAAEFTSRACGGSSLLDSWLLQRNNTTEAPRIECCVADQWPVLLLHVIGGELRAVGEGRWRKHGGPMRTGAGMSRSPVRIATAGCDAVTDRGGAGGTERGGQPATPSRMRSPVEDRPLSSPNSLLRSRKSKIHIYFIC